MKPRALAAAALLGCALCACPEKAVSARGGLRVPLPPGWVADENKPGLLRAGPRGRPLLTLEHRGDAPLPGPEQLEAVLEGQGARLVAVRRDASSVTARYRLEAGPSEALAFVGARRLEGRLFLCASAPEASEGELLISEGICRDLKWGAAAQ